MTVFWGTDMEKYSTIWLKTLARIPERWFFLSAALTVCALWAGLGPESYWLLRGGRQEISWLMEKALAANANALSLPLLSVLPAGAQARKELSGGAVRNILFRCGTGKYLASRTVSLMLSAVLTQCLGVAGFAALLRIFTDGSFSAGLIAPRLLSAIIFALTGSAGALVTRDAACGYVIPAAVCFSLSMLRSRFWTGAAWLDPVRWLAGGGGMVLFLTVLLAVLAGGYLLLLYWEVCKNV